MTSKATHQAHRAEQILPTHHTYFLTELRAVGVVMTIPAGVVGEIAPRAC
eukprot:m.267960 g.267960  ORF g.267960 m.267960 type:complete len:50 (-) comp15647_c1_seq1:1468-1617(-)